MDGARGRRDEAPGPCCARSARSAPRRMGLTETARWTRRRRSRSRFIAHLCGCAIPAVDRAGVRRVRIATTRPKPVRGATPSLAAVSTTVRRLRFLAGGRARGKQLERHTARCRKAPTPRPPARPRDIYRTIARLGAVRPNPTKRSQSFQYGAITCPPSSPIASIVWHPCSSVCALRPGTSMIGVTRNPPASERPKS
jgi:hypothetical protein